MGADILDWQLSIASEAQASSLGQLLGEQRKCIDGRPRLPSMRMTHQRHWLCTAAMVLSNDTPAGLLEFRQLQGTSV
jgi:hypothetical protein